MTPEEQIIARKELEDVLVNNPKSFVQGTRIYIAEEFFALRLDVGSQQFNFALPPKVAKSLAYFLSEQVKNYEKSVREINVDLPPPSSEKINEVKGYGFIIPGQNNPGTDQVNAEVVNPKAPVKTK